MVVAGEVSGDLHAAKLVKAIRQSRPGADLGFFGAAGAELRRAGVEAIVDADHLSVVGLPEIARALPMFLRAFRELKKEALRRKPEAVILVDFPDFNLKLAKSLKKEGLKIIYYISPQLWAWRQYRIKTIKKHVDLLLTILPFEKQWYAERGISHVRYVGSPLAREVHPSVSREGFCAGHSLDPSLPVIALLPGSRHKEIVRILPVMIETAVRMMEKDRRLQFVIALAAERHRAEVEEAVRLVGEEGLKLPEKLPIVAGQTYDALNASDAAAVTSGTATLETAIIGTPLAMVYKTSTFNYKLLRPMIDIDHFGLVNLIAGKRLVRELIQDDLTAEELGDELFRLLEPEENKKMRAELAAVSDQLGHGGASLRAAEAILETLGI